jgi:hypothetical protein
MAAYRHFMDKADLLEAIRQAGFTLFADTLDEARRKAGKCFTAQLNAMGLAYVRFAAEHPAYYEVMFAWTDAPHPVKEGGGAGSRAFGILEETIRHGQEAREFRAGDSVQIARVVWSQVHGISMLRLAPDLTPNGAGTRFVEFSNEILRTGFARTP